MKVWHFLQVSSEIIGNHRYRSNTTTMASSTQPGERPKSPFGWLRGKIKRLMLPAQLRQPRTEEQRTQFDYNTDLTRGGMHQPVED